MDKREIEKRLEKVGYVNDWERGTGFFWYHPQKKFTLMVTWDDLAIWYEVHPVHWCWDGKKMKFIDRDRGTDLIDEIMKSLHEKDRNLKKNMIKTMS